MTSTIQAKSCSEYCIKIEDYAKKKEFNSFKHEMRHYDR